MDKNLDDLLSNIFGTKKELERLAKNQQKQKNKLNELDEMAKQMDDFIENNTQIIKETTKPNTPPIKKEAKKEIEPSPFDYKKFEEQLNASVIGQEQFIHLFTNGLKRYELAGYKAGKIKNALLILGNPGTGKQKIIEKANELLYLSNQVCLNHIEYLDLSHYTSTDDEKLFIQDLYSLLTKKDCLIGIQNFELGHRSYLNMLCELIQTGSIRLNKRYLFNKDQLVENNNILASDTIQALHANNQYFLFISSRSYSSIMASLGNKFIQLFDDICICEDLTQDQVKALIHHHRLEFEAKVKMKLDYTLTNTDLEQIVLNKYDPSQGMDSIQYLYDKLFKILVELKLKEDKANQTLQILDDFSIQADRYYPIHELLPNQTNEELDQVMEEINQIIGLKEVKDYILSLKDHYEIMERRKQNGYKTTNLSKHMIFTGNPGTGKTTMARLLARYLKAIGILESGQLIEVSRGDLVGRYVGHTAPLTKQVIQSALGGVLFIDEAYSLYRGKDDHFGLEAIDTLVKCMEDYRDQLIVVLAGYTKEMSEFLEANSGLKSRFPNIIEFPDYSSQELLDISLSLIKQKEYRLNDECKQPLLDYFERKQHEEGQRSGNGRLARNKIEQAILNQSKRLIVETNAPMDELLLKDFDLID